jgi:hypothetical protein
MRIICICSGWPIQGRQSRSRANFQEIDFDFAQLDCLSFLKPGRPWTEVHANIRPDEAFSLVDF